MVYVGTRNDMTSRSVPAIALQESNDFGGFYFMSLKTGKRIHSNKWSQLPIREDVVKKVQHLADLENQPKMKRGELLFEWEPGLEVFDDYKSVSLRGEENQGANNDDEINRILRYNWALVSDDDTSWDEDDDNPRNSEDAEESGPNDDSDDGNNPPVENVSHESSNESTLSSDSNKLSHNKSRSKVDVLDDGKIEQDGQTNHMNDENESVDSEEFEFYPKNEVNTEQPSQNISTDDSKDDNEQKQDSIK